MINQNCSLIQHDLYSYDIQAAHPSILQKQFFDFKDTDLENKLERNIFIGKSQIGNENLSSFLQFSVDNLIKFYLQENQVSEEETITIQKDGVIIKKMLDNNDEFIPIKYRGFIDFLILTPDRTKYVYISNNKVSIKGVPYLYPELDSIYQKFSNLSFYNKSILFDQMENIKNDILLSTNKKLFMIPKEDSFIVLTYKGDIEIKDMDFVSHEQINKVRYFNHYFRDFLNSIYLECY